MTSPLIPVFTGTLQDQSVQLCNARDLHIFLQVGAERRLTFARLAVIISSLPHMGGRVWKPEVQADEPPALRLFYRPSHSNPVWAACVGGRKPCRILYPVFQPALCRPPSFGSERERFNQTVQESRHV